MLQLNKTPNNLDQGASYDQMNQCIERLYQSQNKGSDNAYFIIIRVLFRNFALQFIWQLPYYLCYLSYIQILVNINNVNTFLSESGYCFYMSHMYEGININILWRYLKQLYTVNHYAYDCYIQKIILSFIRIIIDQTLNIFLS